MKRKSLGFYLRIYCKIISQDIKSKMSYRADFIISTIGMIFTNIAGFVSFWILFRNFPSINGWSYHEMLFLYGFSLVSLTPVQCLFDNNWSLRMYVYSGDFIKYCFRPINLFFYFQSEVFDIKGLGQLAFGIGTIAYSWSKIGLAVTPLILRNIVKTAIGAVQRPRPVLTELPDPVSVTGYQSAAPFRVRIVQFPAAAAEKSAAVQA